MTARNNISKRCIKRILLISTVILLVLLLAVLALPSSQLWKSLATATEDVHDATRPHTPIISESSGRNDREQSTSARNDRDTNNSTDSSNNDNNTGGNSSNSDNNNVGSGNSSGSDNSSEISNNGGSNSSNNNNNGSNSGNSGGNSDDDGNGIGMENVSLQYTGRGLSSFNGGVIHNGETDEGYWIYEYVPIVETGASLDKDGLPLRVGQYSVTGTYNNGRFSDSVSSILEVTPAPLTIDVTLEADSKVYDGTTSVSISSAELSGILYEDIVDISTFGISSYSTPNAGSNIAIEFTDFEIDGIHAWNYFLIQPDSLIGSISRAQYPGTISILVNDDLLRIESELTFAASDNPSDYQVQWRVDGDNVGGSNNTTYTVRPDDADKKITVNLISKCGNYEGESTSTDYVPYTIRISPNFNFSPMQDDRVFIESHGNYTAYAASKNDGYVFIDYNLQHSGFGSDALEFSGGNVSGADSAGSGRSQYFANPDDAVNGIISITAAFYHRGISISSANSTHMFSPIMCGSETNEVYIITIEQLGNAPTGPIHIGKSGNNPEAFVFHDSTISSINIGETYELELRIGSVTSPLSLSGHSLSAEIEVTGDNVGEHSAPVTVRVNHNLTGFQYRDGNHDRTCVGCDFHQSEACSFGAWSNHARTCAICRGVDSHAADWEPWTHGTASQHTRNCRICSQTESDNHVWGNWGDWQHGDDHLHIRTGSCIICERPSGIQFDAHEWGGWSTWEDDGGTHFTTTHCRRHGACTVCGKETHEDIPHVWQNNWLWNNELTHSRPCTRCDTHQHRNHDWGAWENNNPSTCTRHCDTCNRSDSIAHSFSSAHHTATSPGFSDGMFNHIVDEVCPRCDRTRTAGQFLCVFSRSSNTCVRSAVGQAPGMYGPPVIIGYGGCGQVHSGSADNLWID